MSQVKEQKEQDRLNAKLHSIPSSADSSAPTSAIRLAFEKALKAIRKRGDKQTPW
jgi:hypothetical protein